MKKSTWKKAPQKDDKNGVRVLLKDGHGQCQDMGTSRQLKKQGCPDCKWTRNDSQHSGCQAANRRRSTCLSDGVIPETCARCSE